MMTGIIQGDCLTVLKSLPDSSVQMCVTSPPYFGLRDYGVDGQIGLEDTPQEYISRLVDVFHEVNRVLKDDGTLWVNIGDSYATRGDGHAPTNTRNKSGHTAKQIPGGYKPKDLIGIPWMLAFALRADGWYLRQDIIWHKPNVMPESVKDRCTKCHEYIFLLSKSQNYYFDSDAIKEKCVSDDARPSVMIRAREFDYNTKDRQNPQAYRKHPIGGTRRPEQGDNHYRTASGNEWKASEFRNKRDVWTVTTKPYSGAHFATFPEALIEPCILAGSREGDLVLDPFNGAATTGVVCKRLKRDYIGIELNPEFVKLSNERLEHVEQEMYMELNQTSLFDTGDS